MKKIISLIALALCVSFTFEASAQMSKAEAKEWKKRAKELVKNPQQYKDLLDENKSVKGQVTSLRTELSNVDDRIAEKDEQILSYQSQVADLRSELSRAQAAAQSKPVQTTNSGVGDENVGVIFRVQIGAYAKKDLGNYKDQQNFSELKADGLNKYYIGVFRDYWEADTFKKYLREMGAKDAFLVPFKDGVKVSIKEVLENTKR
ncbi:MAG: Ezrin/radixin/moesin family protein [Cyclobacteriaceae bacterium]